MDKEARAIGGLYVGVDRTMVGRIMECGKGRFAARDRTGQ